MPRLAPWYSRSVLKSGKPGNRIIWIPAYFCPLDVCSHCGKLGNANWVKKWWHQGRSIFDMKDSPDQPLEPVLCLGCFNRFRPLWKAANEARENRLTINRLKKAIADVRRNQDDG